MGILHATMGILHATMGILLPFPPVSYQQVINNGVVISTASTPFSYRLSVKRHAVAVS